MTHAEAQLPQVDFRLAREIVDSDPVLRVFAACEWDELSDDGKLWIGTIVAETRRRVAGEIEPAQRCRGNLRPAPFALTPSIGARVLLDTADRAQKGTVEVPVLPTKLVDRPRCSEDPRLAKANDDSVSPTPSARMDGGIEPVRVAPAQAAPSAPVESPNLDRPDIAQTSETRASKSVALPAPAEKARRSDLRHRQAKDRDARELEAPVDNVVRPKADRLAMIRDAAANLARRDALAEGRNPRISLGARAERKPFKLPPLPVEQRRAVLDGAIAHLKRLCILVTPVDRDSLIRKYRVSGKRDHRLAEEVIEIAVEHGFEVPHG